MNVVASDCLQGCRKLLGSGPNIKKYSWISDPLDGICKCGSKYLWLFKTNGSEIQNLGSRSKNLPKTPAYKSCDYTFYSPDCLVKVLNGRLWFVGIFLRWTLSPTEWLKLTRKTKTKTKLLKGSKCWSPRFTGGHFICNLQKLPKTQTFEGSHINRAVTLLW